MSLPPRSFLRGLLESEEGQKEFMSLYKDVMTKRKEVIYVHVIERQVEVSKNGKTLRVVKERMVRQPVEVERYSAKDALQLMSFIASFGVGKPPEEKKVEHTVRQGVPLDGLTREELEAIVDGEWREDDPLALPAGS